MFSGGCACGAIRYECNEEPVAMFNCHCRNCQRVNGGTFVTVALVREAALRLLKGEARFFRSLGDSGRWTDRGFCQSCGTPLFARGEVAPGWISIRPGSLDDPAWFKPAIDTWTHSGPIPAFASLCSTLESKCWNQRTTLMSIVKGTSAPHPPQPSARQVNGWRIVHGGRQSL
jgi:hypothetical protein